MALIEILLATICLNSTCSPPDYFDYEAQLYKDVDFNLTQRTTRLEALANDIKDQTLLVTTLQNDMLSGYGNGNNTMQGTGVAFDLLNILQDKYKFNYSVVKPEANVFGASSPGVLQMLIDEKVDMAAAFLPIVSEYFEHIDFSPSVDTGEWVVLMKRPKESATGSGLLAPFTLPVWLLILLSLLVVGPVIYFIIYIQAKLCADDHNKVFPLPSCIWFVYGALLKQGTTLNPTTDSSRLLFSTWWIFITILTAFYTANLTAFLTLSKFTLPIAERKDIGAKNAKWVTSKGNALEDAILGKKITYLENLHDEIGHPEAYAEIRDDEILSTYVKKKNMMFIREKPIVEYVMYNDYKAKTKAAVEEAKRCTYVITKWSVTSFSRGFAYKKDFKYKPIFDTTILSLVESGIIKYKLREQLPDTEICPLNLGNKERQLRNTDLLMTYQIVGGGFIISLIVFIVELIIRRNAKPRFNAKLFDPVKPTLRQTKNMFEVNLNNNYYTKLGDLPFSNKFLTPPPAYSSLFNPKSDNIKKKNINGRDYWVYDSVNGAQPRMVPLRTPSALLFQFTN